MEEKQLIRFISKVDIPNLIDCWEWKAGKNDGYGAFWTGGNNEPAHRVLYEHLYGELEYSLHLDHLCRNKSCVNPLHLEPVTCKENRMRGANFGGKLYIPVMVCSKGHTKQWYPNGKRQYWRCKTCHTEHERQRK